MMKGLGIPVGRSACFVAFLGLTACGGGGGGSNGAPSVATGYFKDSNVSGLSYVSGGQAGTTGANGAFTYEVGGTVTFSIGGVSLGSATGKSVITPIDLVTGGSSGSTVVQNIVRFLLMLDSDGDSTNGITLSPEVQAAAVAWAQVNFSAADLAVELASIMADAVSADGGSHTLPDGPTARAHLEATFLCAHAGAFKGRFAGDDNGTFGVLVDATTGHINGVAYSPAYDWFYELSGQTALSTDQVAGFVSDDVFGVTFTGNFSSPDRVAGTWEDTGFGESGTFSGSRIGGAAAALYRFTGNYDNGFDAYGLFSFDVNASDQITGVAYDVSADRLLNLSGTVSGTTLAATASDGTVISGTLNKAGGTLSGTWSNSLDSGTFGGSGCKLN